MKDCVRKLLKGSAAAVMCIALAAAAVPAGVFASEGRSVDGVANAYEGPAEINGKTDSDDTNQPGKEALARIQISVGEGQKTPVFKAGDQTELRICLVNNGNTDARNLRIAPVIEKDTDWPFALDKLNYEQGMGTLKAGEKKEAVWGADEKLKVKADVTGKSYKLVFRISYDDDEKQYESDKYVFVKTEAVSGSGQDTPSTDQPSGGHAQSGENPSGGNSSGGNSSGGTGEQQLQAGGVYTGETVISGSPNDGAASAVSSVPRVIVTGFTTQPTEVRAGSDFRLIVHLKNTSGKTAVSNMLFDFQAPASGTEAGAEAPAFLPSSGSSSVYLERIGAGGTSDIAIDLNARADLVQKPYSIELSMKYEDGSGTQYEANSSLAVPVTQEARYELSGIQIAPEIVTAGEEANLSCSIYNLGRVKMYNIKAKFEGDAIGPQEQFIGNLDSGASGFVDSIVTASPDAQGESKCRLILTYEDDAGNVKKDVQDFMITVMPQTEASDMDVMTDVSQEESGTVILPLLAFILAAAAVTAAVLLLKRRKRKMREAEEEALEHEVERFTEDEH